MSDDLQDLKKDYQAISAPPFLATRVAASVADSGARTGPWVPVAVTLTAILVLAVWLPQAKQEVDDVADRPDKPSLTALAALKPSKPSVSTPGMSQLRSVSMPQMPGKPKPVDPAKTQSNNQIEIESPKESTNVYI